MWVQCLGWTPLSSQWLLSFPGCTAVHIQAQTQLSHTPPYTHSVGLGDSVDLMIWYGKNSQAGETVRVKCLCVQLLTYTERRGGGREGRRRPWKQSDSLRCPRLMHKEYGQAYHSVSGKGGQVCCHVWKVWAIVGLIHAASSQGGRMERLLSKDIK